jgi:hypothetical protein
MRKAMFAAMLGADVSRSDFIDEFIDKSVALEKYPLFLSVLLGTSAGMSGVNAVVCYSFGLLGGLLTAFALWRIFGENKKRSLGHDCCCRTC